MVFKISRVRGFRPKVGAFDTRGASKEYFMSEAGCLEWQLRWVQESSRPRPGELV